MLATMTPMSWPLVRALFTEEGGNAAVGEEEGADDGIEDVIDTDDVGGDVVTDVGEADVEAEVVEGDIAEEVRDEVVGIAEVVKEVGVAEVVMDSDEPVSDGEGDVDAGDVSPP